MSNFYEKYWDKKTEKLSDFEIKWPILKKFIPKEKNITVLDFGCGKGHIIKKMKEINSSADYIGVDISEGALSKAKENLPNVEFKKDEDPIPLKDNSIDFIFTSEVIEHIYDTDTTVSELSRVLKNNGELLLTTPYHGFLKNLLITLFNFNKHFNPTGPHIRFFTKNTLFNLLKKHGFKIETYGYYGRFWPISHSIYVLAKKSN